MDIKYKPLSKREEAIAKKVRHQKNYNNLSVFVAELL